MKHSPKQNAAILSLDAPTVRLTGTRKQKTAQLSKMFAQAEERIQGENKHRGDRETLYSKS
ncbi:hypothetical protein J2125_000787 [Erwinia toletana]|uniref:Uncharacterized protein n=1 Tax=Winslowiella toletana TaxID=92490 RepID=A0ABS4P4Q0_9GAMM|nr:hypothetical protein [Winslowiella toletana]MBP2167595.1 hypothetical protein [Winslowiella toletana]